MIVKEIAGIKYGICSTDEFFERGKALAKAIDTKKPLTDIEGHDIHFFVENEEDAAPAIIRDLQENLERHKRALAFLIGAFQASDELQEQIEDILDGFGEETVTERNLCKELESSIEDFDQHDKGEIELQTTLLDPIHPGEILMKEFMEPLGLSMNKLAQCLWVPAGRISEIVNGKRAITADTALRLGLFFSTSPEVWLGMQKNYELRLARRQGWADIEANVKPLERGEP